MNYIIRKRVLPVLRRHIASSKEKQVLALVANGTEEMELVVVVDTLIRSGAKVTIASVDSTKQVVGRCGLTLVADKSIGECSTNDWDLIFCPGGEKGAEAFHNSSVVSKLLVEQHARGRMVGAICASPAVVLAPLKILDQHSATCYPYEPFVKSIKHHMTDKVVVDKNVITSQGPGTSLSFALKLVESLFGSAKSAEVAAQMIA